LVSESFEKVVRLISGAASDSAGSLNSDEIRALNKFGSDLQPDERIEFVGRKDFAGNVAYLDAALRKRLLTRGRNSYEVRFDSVGKLLGSNVDEAEVNGPLQVSTTEHGTLTLSVTPERVKEEFDGKIGADVQFRLMIESHKNDRLLRVAEVLEVDLIDAKVVADLERCRNRIAVLSSLANGWHDGSGAPPTMAAVETAYRLLARNPGLAGSYRIFPTDRGDYFSSLFKVAGTIRSRSNKMEKQGCMEWKSKVVTRLKPIHLMWGTTNSGPPSTK
jgi:hypothetical protein